MDRTGLYGFHFALIGVSLRRPDYTRVIKRATSVNVCFKTPILGEVAHRMMDSTGLKVCGEDEWRIKKHTKERRRIGRKLYWPLTAKHVKLSVRIYRRTTLSMQKPSPDLPGRSRRKSGQRRQAVLTTPGGITRPTRLVTPQIVTHRSLPIKA